MPLNPKQVDRSKSIAPIRKRKDDDDTTEAGGRDEFEEWMQTKTILKPDDQLQLTEAELKEEFTRILTANNPHAPQNIVRYSFWERQYKAIPQVDQLAIHFSLEGNMLHKDSDEAKRQLASKNKMPIISAVPEEIEKGVEDSGEEKVVTLDEEGNEITEEKTEADAEVAAAPETKEDAEILPIVESGEKKLTNQFNFCDRASQTYNNPLRERGAATQPPPRETFSGTATQWGIYDSYIEDFEKQQEKNKEKKPAATKGHEDTKIRKKLAVTETAGEDLSKISRAVSVLERMVNQNTFDEIALDFKYWEDPSDDYRDQQGTLLPLWKFQYEKSRKLAVTALCWSPKYDDLFAVGHGSYDFMKQVNGLICFYSLKNPSFPERIINTESAVMCLDLHPEYPHMVCVGHYDGCVAVYNSHTCGNKPEQVPATSLTQTPVTPALYKSGAKTGKHVDPVWQVKWQSDDHDNNMNFFSISSDGRVTSWTLIKNDMVYHDVIVLKMDDQPIDGPDGSRLYAFGSGTTLDFHKKMEHLFLVGTEEGHLYKCSKAYSSQFLEVFENIHYMAIYKVSWNTFHPNVFITCSADWTVKIWDHTKREPMFVFDLNSPVGDVAWSPYSSTVFAAVTGDGKCHIFDLSINKYEAICEQLVVQKKKTKLTHVSFNAKFPVVIVGDDRGHVTCLKLSPNLRKMPKEKKGMVPSEPVKGPEVEIAKLDRILSLVA